MSVPPAQVPEGKTRDHRAARRVGLVSRAMLVAIRGYQLTLSAFLGRQCRYLPTCSEYAKDAILLHGPVRGAWLAVRRIGRCHPWGGSGYDPVPDRAVPDSTAEIARHPSPPTPAPAPGPTNDTDRQQRQSPASP